MRRSDVKVNARSMLDAAASLALIAAALTLIYKNLFREPGAAGPELEVPTKPVLVEGAPMRGAKAAEAVMIVYSDFQCPFCRRFARDVLPALERRYVVTGRVALVFRHLPLPIHRQAAQAAMLAECAGQQGRFWEMHDRLFVEDQLTEATLDAIPGSLELDMERLTGCLSDTAVGARVRASAEEARALGIRGTPAFLLGRRIDDGRVRILRAISGARPIEDFVTQLDATLAGKPTGWRSWIPFAG